jgi:ERCC4-type nuclease
LIIIDDREDTQHPEAKELLGETLIDRLNAGDYVFLDRGNQFTGIERSEIGNLVQKILSGELEEQLRKCQDFYNSIILMVEGIYDGVDGLLAVYKLGSRGYYRCHVYPHTQYGFVMATLTSLSEMGIEIVQTPNFLSSMEVIRHIYTQRTRPEGERTLFKKTRAIQIPTKLTRNPAVPRLMALCPRLPEKVAIRLINQYGSIWSILNTDEKELIKVEGFSKGLLSRLKESIGRE